MTAIAIAAQIIEIAERAEKDPGRITGGCNFRRYANGIVNGQRVTVALYDKAINSSGQTFAIELNRSTEPLTLGQAIDRIAA